MDKTTTITGKVQAPAIKVAYTEPRPTSTGGVISSEQVAVHQLTFRNDGNVPLFVEVTGVNIINGCTLDTTKPAKFVVDGSITDESTQKATLPIGSTRVYSVYVIGEKRPAGEDGTFELNASWKITDKNGVQV